MTHWTRAILPHPDAKAIILVVEDEPLIRLNSIDLIEDAGFIVVDVASADEALQILEDDTRINVVFTDVEMPGRIDGIGLVHAIRRRWPDIGVIVASGKTSGLNARLPEGISFFSKPIQGKLLIATIEAMTR